MRLSSVILIVALSAASGFAGVLVGDAIKPKTADPNELATRLVKLEQAAADRATPSRIGDIVSEYLIANPRVLERATSALSMEIEIARVAEERAIFEQNAGLIYADRGAAVVGNPSGDVTLVELFDYNCTFCKRMMPAIKELVDTDPNLKVMLREFPILSKESVDAARVAILVAQSKADYWAFHEALYLSRGQVSGETALEEAGRLGLNVEELRADLAAVERTNPVLEQSYEIADKLDVTGTPTFLIGTEVIPGAVGVEVLRAKIRNMRECGSTACAP